MGFTWGRPNCRSSICRLITGTSYTTTGVSGSSCLLLTPPTSRVTISPNTNFRIKHPTIIHHGEHEFIFEGFSMLTVDLFDELPVCKVVR